MLRRWDVLALVGLALVIAMLGLAKVITGNETVSLLVLLLGGVNGTIKGKPSRLDDEPPKG